MGQADKKAGTKPATRKADTVIFVEQGKPVQPATPQPALATKTVETIIIIDPKTRKPIDPAKQQPKAPIVPIDTVIVIKNSKQKKELLKTIPEDEIIKVQKVNEVCGCVQMTVTAQDTVRFEDYLNYSFAFKNNCKEKVFINSGSFGFLAFDHKNAPVRRLRQLQFVKQFKYPEFVEVRPGEEYIFRFGDDPFFIYDLHQGWKYKFTFTYYNTTHKYKAAPAHTYLCNEFRDKTVIIK